MNVRQLNQQLATIQQDYNNNDISGLLKVLQVCANGIFVPDGQTDVMWLNACKCVFKLVTLNLLGQSPNRELNIKIIEDQLTDNSAITDIIDSDVKFDNSRLTFEVINNINALLNVCGDDETMQALFSMMIRRLKYFIKENQNVADENLSMAYTDGKTHNIVDPSSQEGTKRIQRLLRKYHLTKHTPYVFDEHEEPKINVKSLARWALKNKIVCTLRSTDDSMICNIDVCYFELYKIIFKIK